MRRQKSFKYNDPTLIDPSHKICYRCHLSKVLTEFNKCKTGVYRYHNHCRPCQSQVRQAWYQEHRSEELEKAQTYSESEQAKKYRQRRWIDKKQILGPINNVRRRTEEARVLARKQRKAWCEIPQNRIACSLRGRIRQVMKTLTKSAATEQLLGCSFEFLKTRLESMFQPNMTWDNYGEWHIDHIKACATFNLIDPLEQQKCFHYSNLQPLWAKDNMAKGVK